MNYLCHSLVLTCAGCNHPATHTHTKRSRSDGGRGLVSRLCCDVAQQCNVVTPGGCVPFWLKFRNTHTHTHTHTQLIILIWCIFSTFGKMYPPRLACYAHNTPPARIIGKMY